MIQLISFTRRHTMLGVHLGHFSIVPLVSPIAFQNKLVRLVGKSVLNWVCQISVTSDLNEVTAFSLCPYI